VTAYVDSKCFVKGHYRESAPACLTVLAILTERILSVMIRIFAVFHHPNAILTQGGRRRGRFCRRV